MAESTRVVGLPGVVAGEPAGRLKVLVSAYACEPGRSSEPAIGWNLVRQLARHNEVWVLTRGHKRDILERARDAEGLERLRFCYCHVPQWMGVQLHYYLWQAAAYLVARRLEREVGFDVVHHVTFVRYWMPSFVGLLGPRFVWGPVGGGETAPRAFVQGLSLRGRVLERLRDLARAGFHLDPFLRWTARRAALALATTEETAERLRRLGCRRVLTLSPVGLPQEELRLLESVPLRERGPFRVVSVGRLIPWKGYELGVRAFAALAARHPGSEYWLVGDGPERARLEGLARELGIGGRVRFLGQLSRTEMLRVVGEGDVLLHPSLHDSGGGICVEAMAAGRPVVCLDLGGSAVQVTAESGIKVGAENPETAVAGLAAGLARLAEDQELLARLSAGARQRVREHFTWEGRGELLTGLYRLAVENA